MATIFLDLDGTLTDPKPGVTRSIIHALRALGLTAPEPDSLDWVIGPPLVHSLAKLGAPDPDAALALYRERYATRGLYENSVYSGIIQVLESLTGAGHMLCLATAKPHVYARKITAHFGLSAYLSHEFGPELDGTRNNKADLLAHALTVVGVAAKDAVMVGDRHYDFDAAHANGMRAIGVSWGYGGTDELARADYICDTPGALAPLVASLFPA